MAGLSHDSPITRVPVRVFIVVLVTVTVVAVAGLLARTKLPVVLPPHCWAMTASTAFLALAGVSWWISRDRKATWVLLGLTFCWCGDWLGLVKFEFGAMSFLLAHVCFVMGFLTCGISRQRLGLITALVALLTSITAYWLLPHVPPGDYPLVISYMTVISCMVIAAGIAAIDGWPFLLAAAVIFYVSDIAVAGWRFDKSTDLAWAFICYPLYYLACLMLAVSPLIKLRVSAAESAR